MSILGGTTSKLGLDIGTTGLRLVQLRHAGGRPKLEAFGSVALDSKVAQSDSPTNRQQLVAAIKKLLVDTKATSKQVVVGLPSSKVFASLINLPKMNAAELAKSIPYQAEQYVPMAIDQVKYDWLVVDENLANNQMEVLLVGTPNTMAENYFNLIEAAGLEAVAIEPDAFALGRALVAPATTSAVVVLNIGANSTDLVIVYKATPHLIRSIPVGGETLVKTVAQNLNLEHEQATQFLYKFGLAEGKLEGQVNKAIKTSVDSLVSEVDKSNKFFMARYKDVKIEKVVVTGGSSQIPELPTFLANATGLPVEIGNSWAQVDFNPAVQEQLLQASSLFSVAAGLALRSEG